MRLVGVATLGTVVVALVALCATAAKADVHHTRSCGLHCPHDWEGLGSNMLAWQDSGGGPGANVLAATDGTGAGFDWSVTQDDFRCGGGFVTASCPGGAISADDVSASIVTIKNSGSSLCMGASGSTSWDLTMQACDTKPAPNLATVFVYLPGKSCGPVPGTKFASLSWNARFTGQGRVATDNTPGDDLTVTSSPGACVDRLWLPTPS